jgi:hypothetical protein
MIAQRHRVIGYRFATEYLGLALVPNWLTVLVEAVEKLACVDSEYHVHDFDLP